MDKVLVKNLKILRTVTLELKSLNVLTGLNSSGKSTFIQSLLLMRQSYTSGLLTNPIINSSINLGDENSLVRLGTFQDVYNSDAEKNETLSVSFFKENTEFSFVSKSYGESEIKNTAIQGNLLPTISKWNTLNLFSNGFQYLSSDRISPTESYPNPNGSSSRFLGTKGEFTPYILENYGNSIIVNETLIHCKTHRADQNTLKWQLNYWLGEISPNIEVGTKQNSHTNKTELYYNFRPKDVLEGDRKPQNIGFGVTSILPVIVAILISKPGDLLIIENPETHLHAYGQSQIAYLISLASQSGVQIIIETHSDHIINGILVSCNRYEKEGEGIDKNKVKIYFFNPNRLNDDYPSEIIIQNGGRIVYADEGFFDQISIDRRKLMGF